MEALPGFSDCLLLSIREISRAIPFFDNRIHFEFDAG
jgi:hypothetical protein